MNTTTFLPLFKGAILSLLLVVWLPSMAQNITTDPVAENMLAYQRSYGGWPKAINGKKVDYSKPLTTEMQQTLKSTADAIDATIDNKATSREIVYLMKAYGQTHNQSYLAAARSGIDYLLKAQYENGGWPQYYPDKKFYRGQVTFNDDAMVNVLNILLDVSRQKGDYAALGADYASKARQAVEKGVACILKTQVIIDGKLTAWAAQYDEVKLVPAKARAFELPSLASSESIGVLRFLMRIDHPSAEVKNAIAQAIAWFDKVKISGYRAEKIDAPAEDEGEDLVLVADPAAVTWARFYDLKNMQPLFVGRDGVPKKKLTDIENERRAGYAWYGSWGAKLPREYEKWKKSNEIE